MPYIHNELSSFIFILFWITPTLLCNTFNWEKSKCLSKTNSKESCQIIAQFCGWWA